MHYIQLISNISNIFKIIRAHSLLAWSQYYFMGKYIILYYNRTNVLYIKETPVKHKHSKHQNGLFIECMLFVHHN